jgi:predicted  nucleic acid-binding Zn-ribbon protein
MPGIGDTFREIHRLRRHARDLQQEIDRGPIQLKARRNVAAKIGDAHHGGVDELKKLKVHIHEKEVSLKAAHTQIAKYEQQMGGAGDKKQYDAFKQEIAAARQKAQRLEDEILEGMSEVEERTAKLPEQERAAAKAKADLAAFEKEQAERVARLADQLKTTLAQLKAVEVDIPEQFLPQYQRMVTAFGADCLAAVDNHTCAHCHTHITVQQMHEVETCEFVLCRSCGRGLYLSSAARAAT